VNAVLAFVSREDERVSGRLQEWRPPRPLLIWMLWATRLGDGWLWIATGLLLMAGGSPYHRVLAAAAVSAGCANASIIVLKRRFRRTRPAPNAPNPLFDLAFDRFSFPSGHTTNAFALGVVMAMAFPPLMPLAALVAGSIGLSRIVLGHHFLSDVLVGALLGTLIGSTTYLAIFR
jgi:undecaprenyl-diphosphatase